MIKASIRKPLKRMVYNSMFLSISIILGIIETQIPVIPVPGAKLGLANTASIVILYTTGFWDALIINLLRVTVVGIYSGRIVTQLILMSYAGAILSILGMGLFKKIKILDMIIISLIGAFLHVVGDLSVGVIVVDKSIISFAPVMFLFSFGTGISIGILCKVLLKYLKDIFYQFLEKPKEYKKIEFYGKIK